MAAQCAVVRTTEALSTDPPQKEKPAFWLGWKFFFTRPTIQGNSPYWASLSKFPVIVKSIPFSFLMPQWLALVIGDLVTGTSFCGGVGGTGWGSKSSDRPSSGILQHTSKLCGHSFCLNLNLILQLI